MPAPTITALALAPDQAIYSDFTQFNNVATAFLDSWEVTASDINAWVDWANSEATAWENSAVAHVAAAETSASTAAQHAGDADTARQQALTAQTAAEGYRDDVGALIAVAAELGALDPTTANPGDTVIVNATGDGLEFGLAVTEANAAAWLHSVGYDDMTLLAYSANGSTVAQAPAADVTYAHLTSIGATPGAENYAQADGGNVTLTGGAQAGADYLTANYPSSIRFLSSTAEAVPRGDIAAQELNNFGVAGPGSKYAYALSATNYTTVLGSDLVVGELQAAGVGDSDDQHVIGAFLTPSGSSWTPREVYLDRVPPTSDYTAGQTIQGPSSFAWFAIVLTDDSADRKLIEIIDNHLGNYTVPAGRIATPYVIQMFTSAA